MEPFIGMIALFGFDFAPRGWAKCDGQLLPIAQNSALFSLLGTMYGGDGRTTFALPDLRGRVAIGTGQGPGLSPYQTGENGGSQSITLLSSQMPAHTHMLQATNTSGNSGDPSGHILANSGATDPEYSSAAPNTTMSPQSIGTSGGSQPVPNMQPYLALNYCIALTGIFPSRN
jgi:microcystin-dependent protein